MLMSASLNSEKLPCPKISLCNSPVTQNIQTITSISGYHALSKQRWKLCRNPLCGGWCRVIFIPCNWEIRSYNVIIGKKQIIKTWHLVAFITCYCWPPGMYETLQMGKTTCPSTGEWKPDFERTINSTTSDSSKTTSKKDRIGSIGGWMAEYSNPLWRQDQRWKFKNH